MTNPTAGSELWQEFVATTGNETMRAGLRVTELSPRLLLDAQRFVGRVTVDVYASDAHDAPLTGTRPGPAQFAWRAWLADVHDTGRGWSTSEWAAYAVAASLLDPERSLPLAEVLGNLGHYRRPVLRILADA